MRTSRPVLMALVLLCLPHPAIAIEPMQPVNASEVREASTTFAVTDVRKSAKFYTEVLGFTFDFYLVGNKQVVRDIAWAGAEPYAAVLKFGSFHVDLMRYEQVSESCRQFVRTNFVVDDSTGYCARIAAAGAAVQSAAVTRDGKPLQCFVRDPDGHWLMFHPVMDLHDEAQPPGAAVPAAER